MGKKKFHWVIYRNWHWPQKSSITHPTISITFCGLQHVSSCHSAHIVHQCYTQGRNGVSTHAFLKMPLHSPVLTLCMPFETGVKDMTKQLERTSVIDEVIIEKLFF